MSRRNPPAIPADTCGGVAPPDGSDHGSLGRRTDGGVGRAQPCCGSYGGRRNRSASIPTMTITSCSWPQFAFATATNWSKPHGQPILCTSRDRPRCRLRRGDRSTRPGRRPICSGWIDGGSTIRGVARTTRDIDLVLVVNPQRASRVLAELERIEVYVPVDAGGSNPARRCSGVIASYAAVNDLDRQYLWRWARSLGVAGRPRRPPWRTTTC